MNDVTSRAFSAKAPGFDRPIQHPRDDEERRRWQAANRDWWEAAPMRYDWRDRLDAAPGSAAYFAEIDRRFLSSVRQFMPWRRLPFDAVIPFDDLAAKDVLEIGVGHGTHAQLLAPRARSFVGIDLTTTATTMTKKRLAWSALAGSIVQMDAERMAFRDGSFDYVWSWGVVHQSADTRRVLAEINRVLRPGGACTVMIYYRSWWNYHVCGFLRWLLLGYGRTWRSVHHASQSGTDGAIARYYKPAEWRAESKDFLTVTSIRLYGMKSDLVPLPHGRLKQGIMRAIPDAAARLLTRHLRMGSFLVATMVKPAAQ
jgi:ubiquinone/menaquinone biosynthesis C-methylase UbiE